MVLHEIFIVFLKNLNIFNKTSISGLIQCHNRLLYWFFPPPQPVANHQAVSTSKPVAHCRQLWSWLLVSCRHLRFWLPRWSTDTTTTKSYVYQQYPGFSLVVNLIVHLEVKERAFLSPTHFPWPVVISLKVGKYGFLWSRVNTSYQMASSVNQSESLPFCTQLIVKLL